jgi:hypothetical protein
MRRRRASQNEDEIALRGLGQRRDAIRAR